MKRRSYFTLATVGFIFALTIAAVWIFSYHQEINFRWTTSAFLSPKTYRSSTYVLRFGTGSFIVIRESYDHVFDDPLTVDEFAPAAPFSIELEPAQARDDDPEGKDSWRYRYYYEFIDFSICDPSRMGSDIVAITIPLWSCLFLALLPTIVLSVGKIHRHNMKRQRGFLIHGKMDAAR